MAKIEKSSVDRYLINDIAGLDPINVFVENFRPGVGRMTVVCFGDAWSYYWPAMGENHTIESFIKECNADYVVRKLDSQTNHTEDDESKLVEEAKKHIIERRREDDFNKSTARDLYSRADDLEDGIEGNQDLLYDIYGDEWWYCLPQRPSPKYEYLKRIVEEIKSAFKMMEEEKCLVP